jgi:glycosyltransferase involved in cell wall biosynthesis
MTHLHAMQKDDEKVSIVVPFLNEEQNLPELYARLQAIFESRPEELQILFVDDGSSDSSGRWVDQIAAQDSRVEALHLSRNFGHQIAITAGMDYALGDAVIIIDADLQDPPEVIPDLIAKWKEGFEVVYAVRRSRAGETLAKRFLASIFYRLFRRLVKIDVPLDAGDFRLVDRQVVDALREMRELHRFVRGLTCWVGFRQAAVEYDRAARHAGETKYPVWKSAQLAWDAMTSFSGTPLRWVTVGGVLVAALGGLQTFHIIWTRFARPEDLVPGWATIAALILISGGIQLICVGLVGQYISRIFEEVKKRPLYVMRRNR